MRKAPVTTSRAVRIAMKIGLNDIREEARIVHRWRTQTGRLEQSIGVQVSDDGKTGYVFIKDSKDSFQWPQNADYGKFLHDGTKHIDSDPFLEDAAKRKESELVREIEKGINKGIRAAGL